MGVAASKRLNKTMLMLIFYIGGQKVKHVMSPEGTFFAGRKAALESMEAKEGEYSQEDIEIMQSGLKVTLK